MVGFISFKAWSESWRTKFMHLKICISRYHLVNVYFISYDKRNDWTKHWLAISYPSDQYLIYTLYAIHTLTWGAFRLVQCSHSLIIFPQRSQSSSSELATPLVDEDTWLSWLWSWAAVVALLLPDVTDIWEVSEDLREWPFPPKELRDLASVSINLKYK